MHLIRIGSAHGERLPMLGERPAKNHNGLALESSSPRCFPKHSLKGRVRASVVDVNSYP
jgi:hypothetical protein